jgi:transcriptional regulator with XRE-family HTH domain
MRRVTQPTAIFKIGWHGRKRANVARMQRATENLGVVLREARRRAGMTQEELSARSRLGIRTVSDLERDRIARPHRRTVDALINALGLEGAEAQAFRAAARPAHAARPPAQTPVISKRPPLPAAPADFLGREAELEQLLTWVGYTADLGHDPVIVSGAPGAGKTSFAVHAGHRLAEMFADGQIFVGLRGLEQVPRDPHEVLGVLLGLLDVPGDHLPRTLEARVGLFRSLIRNRSVLLILDDAAGEQQVRPLLPGGGSSMVIVTARNTLAGLDAGRRFTLGRLGRSESLRMIGQIAGWHRLAAEPPASLELAELCGRLPLALRVAGNRLAVRPQWTIADLTQLLRDERTRLSQLVSGDLSVRSVLLSSYALLDTTSRRMFRRLALMNGTTITAPVAATLIGSDVDVTGQVLERLADASLLEALPSCCYRMAEPLTLLAQELLSRHDEPAEILRLFAALRKASAEMRAERAALAGSNRP